MLEESFSKSVFPRLCESLKGVVKRKFSGDPPPDPPTSPILDRPLTERALRKFFSMQISDVLCTLIVFSSSSVNCRIVILRTLLVFAVFLCN